MRNFNFLFSNSVQGESDLTRYCPRDAFEMPLTCPRHLFCKMLILSMLLMVIGVGNVWGDSFSHTYTYSEKGTGTGKTWNVTNADDASSYWKVPSTTSSPSVATVEGIFTGKEITSDVVITLDIATFGEGSDPTSSKFAIYNSSDCSSQVTASQGGTLPTSKTFTSATYTISKANALAGFTDNLAIKIASGTKQIRLRSFTVAFSYTAKVATPYTVRFFKTDGSYQDITEVSVGAGVTPPVMSTPCDGWAFQGWSKSESDDDENTDELALVTLTAGKYYPTANTTLYPVYTKDGGTTFSKYEALSTGSTVTNGKYLISTGSYTMAGSGKTGASFSPGTTEATAKEYTITTLGSGVFTIKGPDNKYIGGKDANDGLLFDSSTPSTDAYKWKYPTNGIQNQSYTSRYIRAYGTTDFRHYSTSNGTQAKLYKRIETTITYYYSYPNCCTELGSINGSVNLTQGGNSVTISGWSDVSDVGTYTVRMYKKNGASWDPVSGTASGGSAGTAGTRTGITSGSKSVTYTGLTVESEYKFTVQAIATDAAYCDGEETDVTEINSTDVSSTPFKFRYSICIDDGTGNNWTHHYITPTGNTDEGSVTLTSMPAHVDCYQFKIYGGFSGNWGQTGTGKIEGTTATAWTLNGGNQVYLKTGAAGDYVFTVDYSGTTNPKVSVTYPSADQGAGYVIYYDNSVLNWSSLYYRIGNNSNCSKVDAVLVTGTDKFYKITTPDYDNMDAWHIANNYGWTGSNSVYRTKTNSTPAEAAKAITNSISFQQYVVTGDITVIPTTTHSTGEDTGDAGNNNCEFYTINTPTSGMLTHNVSVGTAAHGTLVATYTNTSGATGQTVAEGANADLAHRCIVTITATADPGYSCTSLTVNGAAFTSGNEHILTADAAIAATFTAQTSTITLDNNDATSGSSQTVTATYDADMPLTTTSSAAVVALSRTGYTFNGWWDATSGGTQYYSYNAGTSTLSSARTWDKTGAQTLKAQWSINSYTLTWAWGGGSTSAASGEDYTAAGSVAYNTALVYPANNTMSRNGYTFTGWSSSATNMPAEALTITAQWEANQYVVTLDANGGVDGATTSVTTTFGQAMPTISSVNLPTREGYRFDGFYTGKTDGTKYYNADGTSARNQGRWSDNQKLFAHWVAQLTFSVNGVIDDELTRDDNTAMPSTATVPTACGDCWVFMGWSTNSSESGAPAYAGGATHEFGEPTTLYAVFGKSVFEWITSTSELVANDNYVLTIVNSGSEYAMSNEAQASYEYEIARTDVTDLLRENADGYFLYNVASNNIWKFTGTSSSGQLYNAAADKYLNLSSTAGSSTSMLNTTDNLTFSVDDIYWTIHGTKYLHPYGVSGGGWEATSSGSWDADEDFSGFLYHQTSAVYATEPSCETYDIVWKVDNTPLASGDQTEETNTCAGIEELPTNPAHNTLECADSFMGWSETELIGEGHGEPADLFTSVESAPAIDEDKTFHAVFATEKTDTRGSYTISSSETNLAGSSAWGGYGTSYEYTADDGSTWVIKAYKTGGNAMQINTGKNSSIKIPDCPTGSFIKSIVVTCTGTNAIGFSDYDYEGSGTISYVAEGSSSTSQTLDLVGKKRTGGYIVPHTNSCAITSIVVNYVQYKDYMTTCCNHIVTLSDGSPANGTVTFNPVGPIETCTAAKEVSMTITPNPGYYLSAWTSSGVTPSSVEPAVITNTANAQTTTVTFAKETTEGTYTAGATFSAKALEGWTWMYKKDADAADPSVDPYAIPEVVEIYKDQYARFIITGYAPADVIAEKQGYVYSAGGVEPAYTTDYLTWVANTATYFTLKGKNPVESTTITFKAVGDASITKTMTIRVKALPLAHFVDNVHNESFADVVATVTTGVVTLTKQTPTHADFTGSALNTCEETHVYLIGWIDKDWADEHPNATHSEIIGAGEGVFYAPNADIDLVAKNGKTYLAVWSKIE